MSQSPTITNIKDINTPERALMLAFLVCHVQFNYELGKNTQRGRKAKNPPASFRQCTGLGAASDLATPLNPSTDGKVYGHIDGYFMPTLVKDAEKWGFSLVENGKSSAFFIPLTAPLANRPLTTWVLSGIDTPRNSNGGKTTERFLPSDNTTNTKYQIVFVQKEKVPTSLQVRMYTSGNLSPSGISVTDKRIILPTYYDRVFASEKRPPTLSAPVPWSWLQSEI